MGADEVIALLTLIARQQVTISRLETALTEANIKLAETEK
jgi:hypothetical protein